MVYPLPGQQGRHGDFEDMGLERLWDTFYDSEISHMGGMTPKTHWP